LLIQNRASVFRLQNPIQNPCSSSPLPLSLSKTTLKILRMKIGDWNRSELGMNWVPKMSRYMGIIRQKQSKNRRKMKSHARKPAQPLTGGCTAMCPGCTTVRPSTMGCAPHHGQPVVATVLAGLAAPQTLRFDLFWTSV